jgi:hypothetical protein
VLLNNLYSPPAGTTFTIIDNDGTDPVVGTFQGLAEGAFITQNGLNLKLSYHGGDGNDVTLTVLDPRPSVGSLTVSPGTITDAGTDLVTLTAGNVFSPASRIDDVSFYLDSTGTGVFDANSDRLLGTGSVDGNAYGPFYDSVLTAIWTGPITGVAPGDHQVFVRADYFTNHDEFFSDPVAATLHVVAAPPVPQVAIPVGPETRVNTATSSKRFFQSIPKVQDSAGRRKTSGNSHDDTRSTK